MTDLFLCRSASVRRSSMREKAALSWKEAVEEGRRFRQESMSSNDDEDDVTRRAAADDVSTVTL